ncbi:exodeoxyribonuclease V subunit alpha [Nocardioides caeni]|uniref:RecBCD enzyme subunit RecD n=1 Tax=Nocardioides caeni TaxID=574700 RepID=A0A4S8N8D2_9ACTN|nr:exodeoxyribonuclease V subunit alpha [Nocardioides caeni]THV11199.1 exodeoxyribonuclease V subunit alpha [Nocardioides caeni]
MTELFETTEATDHRLLQDHDGPLAALNAAGLLTAGDVRTADAVCRLGGESSPDVAVAVALLVRAARSGSVCVDLAEAAELLPEHPWPEPGRWLVEVTASPLADVALRVDDDLVYLHRYWAEEGAVVDDLQERMARVQPPVDEDRLAQALDRLFPPDYEEQRTAAEESARRWTSVITGGPGTGKTTTLARLLAVLADQSPRPLRIALAAPTGKAAARMSQSLARTLADPDVVFPAQDRAAVQGLEASTLHRLLGFRGDNHSRFRHHRGNRLPHDVVVVDEASMVSLSMMARLVEAIRPDARLVLLGDADQLASVEAGAVLHDVVAGFSGGSPTPVSRLETSHRFGEDIGDLAAAVRDGHAGTAWDLLEAGTARVELVDPGDTARIRALVLPAARTLRAAALDGDHDAAIKALNSHRLLCAHREGPFGVARWNDQVAQWLRDDEGLEWLPLRYPGQPLLQTSNDYGLKLWNGDTGVVLGGEERQALFDDGAGGRVVSLARLSDVEVAHALTVHRSQGSEFGEVTVILPDADSRLLTRQLLYTAITRAVDVVHVVGTEDAVLEAVRRQAGRASGLTQRLRD